MYNSVVTDSKREKNNYIETCMYIYIIRYLIDNKRPIHKLTETERSQI